MFRWWQLRGIFYSLMVAVRCHNKMACSIGAIIRIFVSQSLLAAWDRIRILVVPMVDDGFGTCDTTKFVIALGLVLRYWSTSPPLRQ
jgi:hypothetical protein